MGEKGVDTFKPAKGKNPEVHIGCASDQGD